MRLFTAIELPENIHDHIDGTIRRAVGAALHHDPPPLVRRETMHVTLTFLGEVADEHVQPLCTSLAAIEAVGDSLLWVDAIGYFPPRGPIRVVYAGLGGDVDRVHLLHNCVESVCETFGYRKESRVYTPHVTAIRARDPLPESKRQRIQVESAPFLPGPRFLATEFVLMQSDLRPSGPAYTRVARFPLAPRP